MKSGPVAAEMYYADGRTDGRTDMTKVMIAFRSYSNARKKTACRYHAVLISGMDTLPLFAVNNTTLQAFHYMTPRLVWCKHWFSLGLLAFTGMFAASQFNNPIYLCTCGQVCRSCAHCLQASIGKVR
jgi:hypothetical protein